MSLPGCMMAVWVAVSRSRAFVARSSPIPSFRRGCASIPDWDSFVAAVVDAAAERGIALTADGVLAARRESRRTWSGQWP